MGLFLSMPGCSNASTSNGERTDTNIEVTTVGMPRSQTSSFENSFVRAGKFFDPYERGKQMRDQKLYDEAIKEFENALSFADSAVTRAMAYGRLAEIYETLGNTQKQIEYLEKESKATLNENHRAELLKQIEALKASQQKTNTNTGRRPTGRG